MSNRVHFAALAASALAAAACQQDDPTSPSISDAEPGGVVASVKLAHGGTNTNSKTYLGACNGDDEHPLDLEVHRWIGGRWKWILTARVYGGTKYTFYSGIPARYRGKAHGANGDTVEHYGSGRRGPCHLV
jgi:hypothetical protein